MDRIERFEDIIAWQKARVLTRQVYACTKADPFAKDFGLRDQIQRAAVSTMANIAEGYERRGDKEFIQFLSTSKGSCGEVRSHLYAALDQGYVSEDEFADLSRKAIEVSRLIAGLMSYLRESDFQGRKYRTP